MQQTIITLLLFLSVAAAHDDVIFASMTNAENLVTRISCQTEESQHFEYNSITELWGANGGKFEIAADIYFNCLGADLYGKYGNEALKYNVQISNLKIVEGNEKSERKRRRKRGAKEFFQDSWKKVKNFFNRVFGRKTTDGPRNTDTTVVVDVEPTEEDFEEVFSMNDLHSVYSTPFQLIQWANGSIPEIRFSENEVEDGPVRNFKRHLADAFATQLVPNQRKTMETSIMGEHTAAYTFSLGDEKAKLNVAGWGTTFQPNEENNVVVVEKLFTDKDIVQLANSEALNDKHGIDLTHQQTQVFRDGKMISSSGTSSLAFIPDVEGGGKRRRRKRSDEMEEDATSYIHAHTSFNIQLKTRRRRSTREVSELQREGNFQPTTRVAENEGKDKEKKKLRDLQGSLDFNVILEDIVRHQSSQDIQTLFEIVEREVSLKLDEEENSLSVAIRRKFTPEVMEGLCAKNITQCREILQLIALAGGTQVEQVFLHFIKKPTGRTISPEILDLLCDIPRPSEQLLEDIIVLLEKEQNETLIGSFCISLTNLASKSDDRMQNKISRILSGMLGEEECGSDSVMIDVLEAIGNLKGDKVVPQVLQVSSRCEGNSVVEIASAHALRHAVHLSNVQLWIEKIVKRADCDVIKEVVGSLMDKIQDQETETDVSVWPRYQYNKIDELLENQLREGVCSTEDVLLYFSRKKNVKANTLAQNHFGPESEPWEPRTRSRQKRSPWDQLNCDEWTEDNKYTPIQGRDEFESDRKIYNKRKSCLVYKKLGVKGANAEIYAGMFAGVKEPSEPAKYKLFTKFVSGINFLQQQTEVGSFYFYLDDGKRTRAFVRIMGQTRQEFNNDGCTPTELKYRPLKHIPLYMVNIANVQLSLGIHLSSQVSVNTECPQSDVYQLQPQTGVRIGGEAVGTVLFIRGTANLGANLNYKLQFTFTPSPGMCVRGSHGFDPMAINFESYFQLWNNVKEDWGKLRTWKPSFISWQIKKGNLRKWFDDTCIAEFKAPPPPNLQRERE